ncbi:MAG: hypothetical protein LBJ67_03925 [Planctomycetaceae bacterium]|jgi:hypothetical protein|nr:hypothetical protein [Planctomycetaceae bacterium]
MIVLTTIIIILYSKRLQIVQSIVIHDKIEKQPKLDFSDYFVFWGQYLKTQEKTMASAAQPNQSALGNCLATQTVLPFQPLFIQFP